MKKLQSLSLTRLTVLEFGQHLKTILKNIALLGAALITDSVLINYLKQLLLKSDAYDLAMVNIAKSDETAKIAKADTLRDNVITQMERFISVFELSEIQEELNAYLSLKTLFKAYKGIQRWNYEEETNGITNLITDLRSPKYKPHVVLLNMGTYVDRLEERNNQFDQLFDGRILEAAGKEVYDVKAMRQEMTILYNDTTQYILSMAKAQPDADQYNKPLEVINTVRKYYNDRLVKRKPATKDTPAEPIAPMEENQ
jgi:hypothetical protein